MKSGVCYRVERKCSHIDAYFCLPGLSLEEKKKDRRQREETKSTSTFAWEERDISLFGLCKKCGHPRHLLLRVYPWVSEQTEENAVRRPQLIKGVSETPLWFHATVKRLAESSHTCCSFVSAYLADRVWYLKYWNTGWYEHLFDNVLVHVLKYFCQIRAWGAGWAD